MRDSWRQSQFICACSGTFTFADHLGRIIAAWLADRHPGGWEYVAPDGKRLCGSREGDVPGARLPKLSDAGLDHLGRWKELAWLDLGATGVSNAGLQHLQELKSLTSLGLGGTPASGTGLEHLQELKSLARLDLNKTPLAGAGLEHLKELRSLKELTLYGTAVPDEVLLRLQGRGGDAILRQLRYKPVNRTVV